MAKLGELYKITSGGTPSRTHSEYYEDGTIPWVKTGDLKDKYLFETDEKISQLGLENSSARIYLKNTVLLAMYGATIGATSILKIDAATNQACAAFSPREDTLPEYLCAFLESQKDKFIKDAVGGAQPNLSAGYLKTIEFKLPSLEQQTRITRNLSKIDELLLLRKQQLAKLDELVKVRFVEMFGDPANNVNNLPASPMTAICQIIDGDRGKNYPKQEEFSDSGFCLFLNAKNVTAQGFSFENCTYITEEKDALLRNGKLCRGDVVLTTRGTIGNLAFYDTSVPYENIRINSGMVILRMNNQVVSEIFFIEQFKMQLDSIKSRIASGSAQPQLPISTMNKIEMILPPIELQKQFAAFVERVDQQKQTVQQSFEKLELMKKALMQEYFG